MKALVRRVAFAGGSLVAAAVLAAGCDGGHGGSGQPAAGKPTGPRPSASAPADPRAKAVFQDYEAYWSAFLKASDPADPASQEVTAHATGEELDRARAALTARRRGGEAVRGSYQHREALVSISASTATLADCLTPHTAVYAATSGKLKNKDPEVAQPLTVDVLLDHGVWKVSLIKPRATGSADCATR